MANVYCFAVCTCLLTCVSFVLGNPEQGKWTYQLNQDKQFAAVAKHMFKNSKVTVTVSLSCEGNDAEKMKISWLLRLSPCAMEYLAITEDINANTNFPELEGFMNNPITYRNMPYNTIELLREDMFHPCYEEHFKLEGNRTRTPLVWKVPKLPENLTQTAKAPASPASSGSANQGAAPAVAGDNAGGAAAGQQPPPGPAPQAASRQKRQAPPTVQTLRPAGKNQSQSQTSGQAGPVAQAANTNELKSSTVEPVSSTMMSSALGLPGSGIDHQPFAKTWTDGNYLLIIRFKPASSLVKFTAEVTIRTFYGNENYISALDYPLLVFYGVMGVIYIVFGLVWLVLLAYNWQDLLRVQFWIGGVILLGMLEKAVFFGEYENVNKTGVSASATLVFAELVSCLKRTLARMLVIIVSLGFGIVKPRLGQTFHKVLFIGGMFFVFSSIEGYMRATSSKVDQSNQFLYAAVPLAVVDAVICWWIFSSLIQTTRTLRLRRNVVKLSLYRHFTNALIFNVLASVAYMVWFLTQHKFRECVLDWKQLWVDEAFWHVLFVVLLFIIIILWRPSANNQRYAFSPLLDAADEEEDDSVMNDAFDGMKMRGGKNGSPKQRDSKHKMEEDLKWVEDNIPTSVADKALPSMLDSDEEMMTTKFEMSKME